MLQFISRLHVHVITKLVHMNIIEGPDSQKELHELRSLISGKYACTSIQCMIKFPTLFVL